MRVMDGGFSVNQVVLEDEDSATLTISPFSGDAHICPTEKRKSPTEFSRINVGNAWIDISYANLMKLKQVLYPPSPEEMSQIMLQGYHDATAFLARKGVIESSCTTCLTVKTKYTPSEVLRVSLFTLLLAAQRKICHMGDWDLWRIL
jgi:hypothetical protein